MKTGNDNYWNPHWVNKWFDTDWPIFLSLSNDGFEVVNQGLSIYKGSLYFDNNENHSLYVSLGNTGVFLGQVFPKDSSKDNKVILGFDASANVIEIGYDGRIIDASVSGLFIGARYLLKMVNLNQNMDIVCGDGLCQQILSNYLNCCLEENKMGWRGYKGTIDVGMLFRKMYCHKCGAKLKIKKNTDIVSKGDEGYSNRMPGKGNALGMSSYYDVSYIYCCPTCGLEITYDKQCIVAKKTKTFKKENSKWK